jgi:DNA polymerase theta
VKGYAGLETTQPIAEEGEDIAICTIEKANAAVNRLILEGRIAQLACVVVDEMHMISDPNRGVMLELTITKILYAERKAGRRACQVS